MRRTGWRWLAVLLVASVVTVSPTSVQAVTFDFNYDESDGTFTAEHRAAIELAGEIWSQWLTPTGSNYTLSIDIEWDPDHNTAWARADRIYDSGLDTWVTRGVWGHNVGSSESIGTIGYSTTRNWDMGLDGFTTPSGYADMVTTSLHEIGHLMGMVSSYRGNEEWGIRRLNGVRKLDLFDTHLRDDFDNAPTTGSSVNFVVDDPIWFVGPNAVAAHGGPVQIFAPDPDPDIKNPQYPNIAHPVVRGGLMTYGGRSRSQRGLFDYEEGMFRDLGLSFVRPDWMHLTLRWHRLDHSQWAGHDVWHNGANWDFGLHPTSETNLSFHMPDATSNYVMHVTKNSRGRDFWMGGSPDAQARLEVERDVVLQLRDVYLGGEPTSNANLLIRQDSALHTQAMRVGYDGYARFSISGSGNAYSNLAVLGSLASGEGEVSVRYGNARWMVDGLMVVGYDGQGDILANNGGRVEVDRLQVAARSGSSGTVRVGTESFSSDDARFIVDDYVAIGGTTSGPGGVGNVRVERGGGLLASGNMYVWEDGTLNIEHGESAVTAASLQIDGGVVRQHEGTTLALGEGFVADPGMHVGLGSTASNVDVRNGGQLFTSAGNIDAWTPGERSIVRVRGLGTLWDNDGPMSIGNLGDAEVHVTDRARVNSRNISMGQSLGTGLLVVASPDDGGRGTHPPSYLENQGFMRVGDYGMGDVRVMSGGHLFTENLTAGIQESGYAHILVSGSELSHDRKDVVPSLLEVEDYMYLGMGGWADFHIEKGGRATAGEAHIAHLGGGVAIVRDRDSHWEIDSTLSVGVNGRGVLEIYNQGRVDVGGSTIIGGAKGSGILRIDEGTLHTGSLLFDPKSVALWEFSAGDVIVDGGMLSYPGQDLRLDGSASTPPVLTLQNGATAELDAGRILVLGETGGGDVNVLSEATLHTHTGIIGHTSSVWNQVVVSDPGSSWTSTGDLIAGAAGRGALGVMDAGTVSSEGRLLVGIDPGSFGFVMVTGADTDPDSPTFRHPSLLSVDQEARIGQRGDGLLQVDQGGAMHVRDSMHVGMSEGGQGLVLLGMDTLHEPTGGGVLQIEGNLHIAHTAGPQTVGAGQVRVGREARLHVDQTTYVGPDISQPDVFAELVIEGGDATTGDLFVRQDGNLELSHGRLTVSGGTFEHATSQEDLYIDGTSGGNTMILRLHNGAQSSNIARLDVGHENHAEVDVRTGSTLTTTTGHIGYEEGSQGTVVVMHNNSSWEATSGPIVVGHDGQGLLRVIGGASVSGQYVTLGRNASAYGEVEISGNNATLTTSTAFNVGWRGEGSLEVHHGGTLTSGAGRIAGQSDSVGHARIDGQESTWTASSLAIGGTNNRAGGQGTLTLANGGQMVANGNFRIWQEGVLQGEGQVTADEVINMGLVDPGNSTGAITINGDYTQDTDGTLSISLAGVDSAYYDHLAVSGTASLAGTLDVSLLDDFIPAFGDTFDILSFDNLLGEFDETLGLDLGGLYFDLIVSDNDLSLETMAAVGNMNLDLNIDFDDINPFMLALNDPTAYETQYGVNPVLVGDINGDGQFDFDDINPFVALLQGGSATVPEPTSLVLLCAGGLTLLRRRRCHAQAA